MLLRIFSLLCFLTLLTSCVSRPDEQSVGSSSKTEDAIVARWRELNGSETIEFRKDGTFLISNISGGPNSVSGTYFVDDELISLKPSNFHPMTCKYKLANADLVLTFQQGAELKLDGSMAKYRKVP